MIEDYEQVYIPVWVLVNIVVQIHEYICTSESKFCTWYGILLATNAIFEVQGWYSHENVCELQAWQQSFVFSGVLLCVSPVGHTKGCYIDQYDMW